MTSTEQQQSFTSWSNKTLLVRKSVVLTASIDAVIAALDVWFTNARVVAEVSSGLRTPDSQLELIRHYAKVQGVDREFPRIRSATLTSKSTFENDSVFDWQPAWSRLLNVGLIISPPLSARVLFDYVRDGRNLRGEIRPASPHIKGTAFDVVYEAGSSTLDSVRSVLQSALVSRQIVGYNNILVERVNNCLHNDCALITAQASTAAA